MAWLPRIHWGRNVFAADECGPSDAVSKPWTGVLVRRAPSLTAGVPNPLGPLGLVPVRNQATQ